MADYYVSPTGTYGGAGTIADPWNETAAGEFPAAGDTVYFRGGTYTGQVRIYVSGTSGNPITWRNYPGESPIMQPTQAEAFYPIESSWLVFDGFEILRTDGKWEYMIMLSSPQQTIRNCTFHGGRDDMLKILTSSSDVLIEDCTFYDFHHNAIDCTGADDVIIRRCTFYQAYGTYNEYGMVLLKGNTKRAEVYHCTFIGPGYDEYYGAALIFGGIMMDSQAAGFECEDSTAHDNLFYDLTGPAIAFWEANNCAAYNNTFVRTGTNSTAMVEVLGNLHHFYTGAQVGDPALHDDSQNITLQNNIFYDGDASNTLLYIAPECDNNIVTDYNIWWPAEGSANRFHSGYTDYTWAGYQTATSQGANSLIADPLFVDAANDDYHLTSGSPPIDAGTDPGTSWTDLDLNMRPAGATWDIGAYEYGGSVALTISAADSLAAGLADTATTGAALGLAVADGLTFQEAITRALGTDDGHVAPVDGWHQTSTQVDLLLTRATQSGGAARTGLTITDFAVNLWDQANNNDYTKAAGAAAPGSPTIAVTVNEVADGLYEWSFTPDAAGQFKLLVEYPTDSYVASATVVAVTQPVTVYVSG